MIRPAVSFAYRHMTTARNCWMLESYLCMFTGLKNCSTSLGLKHICYYSLYKLFVFLLDLIKNYQHFTFFCFMYYIDK
jgi:hypothetical protein